MSLRLGALMLLAVLLSACVSTSGDRETNAPIGVVIPPPTTPGPTVPLPRTPDPLPIEPAAPPPPPSFPRSAEQVSGQAVVSLMRKANTARAAGQYELAASELERAQRIEPRNYFVWSALAKVYLAQEQFDQAVSVAGKSNSLARGNIYVEVENWKTIAAARRAQGDSIGALQAQARIEEIQRQLGGS